MAKKRKEKKTLEQGRIYITATFNNTLVTVTDRQGQPVLFGSCGMYGFSGTRKSTPYAATVTVQATLKKAIGEHNLKLADVYVRGIGPGREAAMRVIRSLGLEVNRVLDITPIPHNGVRPPKMRRG